MTTRGELPDVIQQLHAWLVSHGFTVVSDDRGGMGGVLLTMTGHSGPGPVAWIEISGDRGHWAIGLRFDGMSRYIPVASWADYLHSAEDRDDSVERQAAFLESRLDHAALAYLANPLVESKLVSLGEEYMRRKYPHLFRGA